MLGHSLQQARQGLCAGDGGGVKGLVEATDNSQGDEMNFKKMMSAEKKREHVMA